MPQRVVHHHRAEIRTADADVDDGPDRLARRTLPLAGTQPVGERTHLVEHLVHVGDHILPVDGQSGTCGQSQRRVQHGAVLRGVDVLAGEHRRAPLFEAGRAGQVDQQVGGRSAESIPQRFSKVSVVAERRHEARSGSTNISPPTALLRDR